MVRRNLQETGEFDEPVTVITHWKKKKGNRKSLSMKIYLRIPISWIFWV